MVTVRDLQRARERQARVNHETYKQLLRQVQDRLRARASNKARDMLWQVPPLVPGRPVYKTWHAARYVSDKLRLAGFSVSVATPAPDVHVLHITWDPVAKRRAPPTAARDHPPAVRDHPPPAAARDRETRRSSSTSSSKPKSEQGGKVDVTEAARRVENLRARLLVG